MHPTLNIALRAAHAASEKLVYTREHWATLTEESGSVDATIKGLHVGAGKRAFTVLHNAHPQQTVECTQTGTFEVRDAEPDTHWKVDIMLGETNYLRGLPGCGVLISQWQRNRMEHACIVFPFLNLEIMVSRGRGLQVNGRRVRTRQVDRLSNAYFGGDLKDADAFMKLAHACQQSRLSGCALLDITDMAAGKLDIVVLHDLSALELATAQLLATEAGAVTGDLTGSPIQSAQGNMVGANPRLFKATVQLLRDAAQA
ncbi:MAG: hypothetical protein JXQ97_13060 [Natronospirillum sp.]